MLDAIREAQQQVQNQRAAEEAERQRQREAAEAEQHRLWVWAFGWLLRQLGISVTPEDTSVIVAAQYRFRLTEIYPVKHETRYALSEQSLSNAESVRFVLHLSRVDCPEVNREVSLLKWEPTWMPVQAALGNALDALDKEVERRFSDDGAAAEQVQPAEEVQRAVNPRIRLLYNLLHDVAVQLGRYVDYTGWQYRDDRVHVYVDAELRQARVSLPALGNESVFDVQLHSKSVTASRYRPGAWEQYVTDLAQLARDKRDATNALEAARDALKFQPIDDDSLFDGVVAQPPAPDPAEPPPVIVTAEDRLLATLRDVFDEWYDARRGEE